MGRPSEWVRHSGSGSGQSEGEGSPRRGQSKGEGSPATSSHVAYDSVRLPTVRSLTHFHSLTRLLTLLTVTYPTPYCPTLPPSPLPTPSSHPHPLTRIPPSPLLPPTHTLSHPFLSHPSPRSPTSASPMCLRWTRRGQRHFGRCTATPRTRSVRGVGKEWDRDGTGVG